MMDSCPELPPYCSLFSSHSSLSPFQFLINVPLRRFWTPQPIYCTSNDFGLFAHVFHSVAMRLAAYAGVSDPHGGVIDVGLDARY